jgi:hypothetical protein
MPTESDQFPCNSMDVFDWKIAINTKTKLRRGTKDSLKRQTADYRNEIWNTIMLQEHLDIWDAMASQLFSRKYWSFKHPEHVERPARSKRLGSSKVLLKTDDREVIPILCLGFPNDWMFMNSSKISDLDWFSPNCKHAIWFSCSWAFASVCPQEPPWMVKPKLKSWLHLRTKFNECALFVLCWPFRLVEAVRL